MKYVGSNLIGPSVVEGYHLYGLANQLFQVATTLSYAIDNNLQAVFPILRDTNRQGNYKDNIFRNLVLSSVDTSFTVYQEPSFKYSKIPTFESSVMFANSYFQSEKYFSHNRNSILEILSPSEEHLDYITDKYGQVLKNSTSLHVRRGDYLNLKHVHSPLYETDYYPKALSKISTDSILVFSDDISWCKQNINDSRISFVENEEDYMDLYIMSMCDNNIIANSTFSWWGAWLNSNADKQVIAPSQWFGHSMNEPTEDLIPKDWIVI